MNVQFIILIRESDDDKWRVLDEGPWGRFDDAMEFAEAEIGVQYVVCRVVAGTL